ncbi:hypothetical protein [Variovorax sp. 3P27G3]|jgi:peroxiredoxin family protein|uniref:hypothetical protein n=1 Tax=Variovorax sp. 3P27G3 TaxID=2502214 RepID=UPI0010FA5724|nr:hypothetical protein [Variovorax sp. 3P27G3]
MSGLRQFAVILWPSFLVACGMEVLVFALFDPLNTFCGADALRMSRQSLYTASFFVFWLMAGASSACTMLLAMSPAAQRPDVSPRTSS